MLVWPAGPYSSSKQACLPIVHERDGESLARLKGIHSHLLGRTCRSRSIRDRYEHTSFRLGSKLCSLFPSKLVQSQGSKYSGDTCGLKRCPPLCSANSPSRPKLAGTKCAVPRLQARQMNRLSLAGRWQHSRNNEPPACSTLAT